MKHPLNSPGLESSPLTKENLLALYRLVLLLTGDGLATERIMMEVLGECAHELAQLRSNKSSLALAMKKLRERCLKRSATDTSESPAPGDTDLFARRFSLIPEPGRSALALLYLKIFPVRDTAALLNLNIEDFSNALEKARAALGETGANAAKPAIET